ncbi:MAG: DUF1614 domain-containing protein [Candidatus Nezhaarchaeales archaeon]
MSKRIIIQLPIHPMFLALFLLLGLMPLLWFYLIPRALAQAFQPLGLNPLLGYIVALLMVFLSIVFSAVNIAITEVPRQVVVPEIDYVWFFGLPYPIPRLRLVVSKTIVAVNVGGALVPLTLSTLMLALFSINVKAVPATLATACTVAVVATVSHIASRVIPGVGIVVPALVPPLAASLPTILLSHILEVVDLGPAIAYIGAVIGTLIGADVVNLVKHFHKLQSPLVSIGGAGTFDGIYLSGIVALLLTFLFT